SALRLRIFDQRPLHPGSSYGRDPGCGRLPDARPAADRADRAGVPRGPQGRRARPRGDGDQPNRGLGCVSDPALVAANLTSSARAGAAVALPRRIRSASGTATTVSVALWQLADANRPIATQQA